MIAHIYPSVLQAVSGRGYAGCLDGCFQGYWGEAMQDLGYELPRIPIPRRWMNSSGQDSSPIHSGLLKYASWERAQEEVHPLGDTKGGPGMRRRGLWAACVVLLVGVVGVLAVGTGFANDEDAAGAKCSEATLDGTYLFAFDGSTTEGKDQVPFAVAGYQVFNGNGKANGVSSFSVNGEIFSKTPSPARIRSRRIAQAPTPWIPTWMGA